MLRTVDGPLLRVLTKPYYHVFLSLANLNIQKILKHSNTRRRKAEPSSLLVRRVWCTRREPRLTDNHTEPSSPRPPAPERTNTNCCLKMQTEKICKRAQFSTCAWCSVCTGCVQRNLPRLQNVKIPVLESILGEYP